MIMDNKNDKSLIMDIINRGAEELQSVYDKIKENLELDTIWHELAKMGSEMDSIIEKTKKEFREHYHKVRDKTTHRDSIHSLDKLYRNLSDTVYDARQEMDKFIENARMKVNESMDEYRERELGRSLRGILDKAKERITQTFEEFFPKE